MNLNATICVACGQPMERRSLTSAGASWACPCGRTTYTSVEGGKLEQLDQGTIDLGLVTDDQLGRRCMACGGPSTASVCDRCCE